MSTRVELPVPYPVVQDRDGEDWHLWKDTCVKPWIADEYAKNKHLTDAELAAEYWRSWNLFKTATITSDRDWAEYDRSQTILRFATTPHHTEVAA